MKLPKPHNQKLSLTKVFINIKSFKYLFFSLNSLIKLSFYLVLFFFILSSCSLHFVSWHFCQTPSPPSWRYADKIFQPPPLSGVSWYVNDPLYSLYILIRLIFACNIQAQGEDSKTGSESAAFYISFVFYWRPPRVVEWRQQYRNLKRWRFVSI